MQILAVLDFRGPLKLFYMILLMVDARWCCTTHYPKVQRYSGVPRSASYDAPQRHSKTKSLHEDMLQAYYALNTYHT